MKSENCTRPFRCGENKSETKNVYVYPVGFSLDFIVYWIVFVLMTNINIHATSNSILDRYQLLMQPRVVGITSVYSFNVAKRFYGNSFSSENDNEQYI